MRLSATRVTAAAQGRGLGNQLWDLAGNRPSLDLRFAESKSLVDATTGTNLIDFTRASSGTYVGSDGLIKTATTNLLLRSEEFNDASWNKGNMTVTANALAAPNGTVTADLIDTATETSGTVPSQAVNVSNSTTYTLSVYVKTGSATWIRFRTGLGTGSASLWYDINNGSFSASNAIFAGVSAATAGDGWRRVVLTVSYGASDGGTRNISITPTSSNGGTAPFGTVYLWGAQLEQSSTVGEYVKTTSTINSAPRFDHDPTTGESLGLLVEEQRTNLCLQSQAISTSPWSGNGPTDTCVASTLTDPAGTLTAFKVNTEAAAFGRWQQTITVVNGTTYTLSAWVRSTSGTAQFRLRFAAGVSSSDFTATTSWQRFTFTTTAASTTGAFAFQSPSSGTATEIHVWGAQLEAGSFPTSYIPTTTATVTRAADVASISGSNFSSWYRQDEGTLFLDAASAQSVAAANVGAVINDGSMTNRIELNVRAGSLGGAGRVTVTSGGATSFDTGNSSSPAFAVGTFYRQVASYKLDSFAYSLNGGVTQADTSGGVPTAPDRMEIGARLSTTLPLNGTILRLTYWPQRLSNNVLQSITQ